MVEPRFMKSVSLTKEENDKVEKWEKEGISFKQVVRNGITATEKGSK